MLSTTNNVKVDPVPVDLKISVDIKTMIGILIIVLIFLISRKAKG